MGLWLENISRLHRVSKVSIYKWETNFSCLDTSALRCLSELEVKNGCRKLMCCNFDEEHITLREIVEDKNCLARRPAGAARACPNCEWAGLAPSVSPIERICCVRHYQALKTDAGHLAAQLFQLADDWCRRDDRKLTEPPKISRERQHR